MWDMVLATLSSTLKIILMVALFMVITEFLELKFKREIRERITGKRMNQYLIASLLGAIPGCMDAFFVVSLYIHGLVGFGALVAVMLSTAGDEAFIMLATIPKKALLIFAICVIVGIVGGFSADRIADLIKLETCQPCEIEIHEEERDFTHFLREHVYAHVIKKHVIKLFLWIFLTMIAVEVLIESFDLGSIISSLPASLLIVFAALIGIVPESGPHLFFLVLFSRGVIPLSVLLVNTISQDGHGLLPLLSHSVKDTVYVQIFTTSFALLVGIGLSLVGV